MSWIVALIVFFANHERSGYAFSPSMPKRRLRFPLRDPQKQLNEYNGNFSPNASALQLSTSATAVSNNDDVTTGSAETVSSEKNGKRKKILVRAVVALTIFALGYVSGGGNAKSAARTVLRQPKRFPVLSVIGVALIVKEFYNAIPVWIKRRLPIVGKRQKLEAMVSEDPDDMTDLSTLALKLRKLFSVAQDKLANDDEEEKTKNLTILPQLLAISQTLRQKKGKDRVVAEYIAAGEEGSPEDIKGYDRFFEYADWAYDEDLSGVPLKELLRNEGFSLLRHDKTTLPGFVGHYVALNKEKKLALIGVKGTSTIEDILTDCCGLAVSYELPGPFVEGGKTEIRCHEGILISSKRLADDLQPLVEDLLLPTGYEILVVGHSLGAASAGLFGVMMRARIPALRQDAAGEKLRVLAFASPPVLDYDNALDCTSFCTTTVNNSDIIPRASLANLIIGLEVLKRANDKLEEKNLDYENNRKALIQRLLADSLKKDEETELLLEPEELVEIVDDSIKGVDMKDPDHLYVPGKVVLLCDKDKEEIQVEEGEAEQDNKDGFIVLAKDGTTDVLRTIFVDERMVFDHLAQAYRSSFRTVMKPVNATDETIETEP